MWSEIKEPKNKIALRAVEEIQKVKQARFEKQNRERLEEAKKQQKAIRLENSAKTEVAKRVIVLERESLVRKQKVKAILSGDAQSI